MHAPAKAHLREFQARLTERLRHASVSSETAQLGVAIGERRWLVDLAEAGEIAPVPGTIAEVPLTRSWLRGLVNLRGNLYAVSDLARFADEGDTPIVKESRLLAFSTRLGVNAALLVTRMLGLHATTRMQALEDVPARSWQGRRYVDAEGRDWTELSLSRLAADERFLVANR